MSLTEGTGHPPAGWDPQEATERVLAEAQARPEHIEALAQFAKDSPAHCPKCAAS